MRIKRIETLRRTKIPLIVDIQPGQEYLATITVFCSLEEINRIPAIAGEILKDAIK